MTLTTSSMWVSRSMAGPARWMRSPSPVRVGVWTSWPGARSSGATQRQHQPPTNAPWIRTKVAIATFCGDPGSDATAVKPGGGRGALGVGASGCGRGFAVEEVPFLGESGEVGAGGGYGLAGIGDFGGDGGDTLGEELGGVVEAEQGGGAAE